MHSSHRNIKYFFFFKVVEELHLVESFVLNQGTSTIHQMSHWPYTGLVEQVCVEHDLHICFFFFFFFELSGLSDTFDLVHWTWEDVRNGDHYRHLRHCQHIPLFAPDSPSVLV